jgi:hypothetical protein
MLQKSTRPQDKPINIGALNANERAMIKSKYPELIDNQTYITWRR